MASYNLKVIDYEEFVQYRFYSRVINKIEDKDNTMCEEVPDNRKALVPDDDINPFDGTAVSDLVDLDNLPSPEEMEIKRLRSMEVSRNRTVQTIYGYAQANRWDWFVTLTFRRDRKIDVTDYDTVVKKLTKWLNNQRVKCPDLKYLFVPERHLDGAFHFHGLLANADGLEFYDSGRVAYRDKAYVRTDDNKDLQTIYNLEDWHYGFTTATRVNSSSRASAYICKYITKEVIEHTGRRRRFYPSRNLNKPAVSEHLFNGDDLEELLSDLSADVNYLKTQVIPDAHLTVKYVQVMKKKGGDDND